MKKWLALGLSLMMGVSQAAIYMHVDENGNTVYSDTNENPKAKMVVMPASGESSSAVSAPRSLGISSPMKLDAAESAVDDDSVQNDYTTFTIVSPKDNETLPNPVTISVNFDIKPTLQNGDKVQLMVDNKPAGEAVAGTSGILPWIERGAHQVSAVIIDSNQKVIKSSNSITIYIQRSGVNSPARQQSMLQKKDDHKMLPISKAS